MPKLPSTFRLSSAGSHQVTECVQSSGVCKPGLIELSGKCENCNGRESTVVRPNAGQEGAGRDSRYLAFDGYRASFSAATQPLLNGPSPTAGMIKRSRARVAATYATRVDSATSRSYSSPA